MSQKDNVKEQINLWGDYSRAFGTTAGKAVLESLKKLCGSLMDTNPFLMAYKVGQHDLVSFIEDMIAKGKNPSLHLDLINQAEKADEEQED